MKEAFFRLLKSFVQVFELSYTLKSFVDLKTLGKSAGRVSCNLYNFYLNAFDKDGFPVAVEGETLRKKKQNNLKANQSDFNTKNTEDMPKMNENVIPTDNEEWVD